MPLEKKFKIEIDTEKCKGCGLCVSECRSDVLGMSKKTNNKGYFYAEFDGDCNGCGACYTMCPDVCISAYRE